MRAREIPWCSFAVAFAVACGNGAEPSPAPGAAGSSGGGLGGAATMPLPGTTGGTPPVAGASGTPGGAEPIGGSAPEGGVTAGGGNAGGGNGTAGNGSSAGSNQGGGGTGGSNQTNGGASGGGSENVPACPTNQLSRCSGSPLKCDFGGEPGDFLVTVELGGAKASSTYVEAESYRRVLGNLSLAAGETKRYSFGVNVRQPEGQPIQDVPAGTPGLQLYFRGSSPSLSSVCVQPLKPLPKLWIAGDSTVCDQDGTDYAGWGQHLPQHFKAPVSVANYADSGESSTTVLNSPKMWGAIKGGWKAGDWVLVQVGHNDKDVTASTFQANMTAFVTQAKAASVNIVLCTPIARVGYALADEHHSSTGANLPQIIKDVAKSQNVPLIDLTTLSWNWLQTIDWKQYFALGTDRTHTNPAGAEVIAGLVKDAILAQHLELAQYVR